MEINPRNLYLTKLITSLFDSIEEIVSIGIAIQIIYLELTAPGSLQLSDLILRVLAIVTFLAISSLRDKLYRFRSISNQINDIHSLLNKKVFDPIRVSNLFQDELDLSPGLIENAQNICISGITLVKTIGRLHEPIFSRVVEGAQVRIILLDSSAKDALLQLKLRSWGPVKDGYYETRIQSTVGQIEVIGENINASSNATGSLELGLLPFVPSFGMVLTDPNDILMAKAWIEIYHHRTDNTSPRFMINHSKDPQWFEFFQNQFEKMWELCDVRKIV
jgi:hypothetical protein